MLIKAVSSVLPKKTRERFVQLGKISELQSILRVELLPRNYNGYKTNQECLEYFSMPRVTLNGQFKQAINNSSHSASITPINQFQHNNNISSSNSPMVQPRPMRPPAPQANNNPPTTDDLISF